ncbi:MAG: hypothetical protein VB862_01010 [Pirellulaceae bacterium]
MQTPIPQLTALLLFMHISFGCCLHHVHTCDVNGADSPAIRVETCPCSDHQHDNDGPLQKDDEQSSEQDKSPSGHSCGGDPCVFNKPETSSDVLSQFTHDLVASDITPEFSSPHIPSTILATAMEARHTGGYPPLRTHLFHQILLI